MKKTLFAFRWLIISVIFGLSMLGLLMISGFYVPSGIEVTSEAIARKCLYTGLTIWIFLIGIPLVALMLGIREATTGKGCGKKFAQE
jgi:hypothetical protein